MEKRIRVIIDADTACEADDSFAIVHALLSPQLDVRAVASEHFIDYRLLGRDAPGSEAKSYKENARFLAFLQDHDVRLLHGAKRSLTSNLKYEENEASRFIIEEAHRQDERPLFVVAQGAVTNIGTAYLMDRTIADKLTVISISGGSYPEGGPEYNVLGDIHAMNLLMDSPIPFWQIPSSVYGTMCVSFQELAKEVAPYGQLGRELMLNLLKQRDSMCGGKLKDSWLMQSIGWAFLYPMGTSWRMGDSPVVGLLLDEQLGTYSMEPAPLYQYVKGNKLASGRYILRPGNPRKIRVYHSIDSRWILADFYQKIQSFATERQAFSLEGIACPVSKQVHLVLDSANCKDLHQTIHWAVRESKVASVSVFTTLDLDYEGIEVLAPEQQESYLVKLAQQDRRPIAYLMDSECVTLAQVLRHKVIPKKLLALCCEGNSLSESVREVLASTVKTRMVKADALIKESTFP